MARQLALALALQTKAAWHTELNSQLYRESEIVSLLLRATSWTPDPELLLLLPSLEAAWLPRPTEGMPSYDPRRYYRNPYRCWIHSRWPCGRSSLKAVD